MQRLPASFVSQLDLVTSVQKEATAWRNLVPPEPWTDAVVSRAGDVAAWVGARLESGGYNAPASSISVRKNLQGTRPVPILGIGERVAYRAISGYVMTEVAPAARSQEDYNNFATGPIVYAYGGQTGPRTLRDSKISYVIEADISSFYQYIDHEMLRRELELQTGRVEAVDFLIQLLGDIQGASYGIPQLIDASDELSEAYARMLERDIIRQGLPTWRYNDDFRIGATSYETAQGAIEKLSEAARSLGLILNDQKTYISRILTYALRHLSSDSGEEPDTRFDPENLVVPSDYQTTDEESAEQALNELKKLDLPPGDEGRIDLKRLKPDDLRRLRSAIRKLRAVADPGALGRVVHLYLFAPALTPRLSEYMITMHPAASQEVERIWDALAAKSDSLSEWQLVWLTYIARTLNLVGTNAERITQLKGLLPRGRGGLLHAELQLTLSEASASTFRDLDNALRSEPEPLAPWYALGIKALNGAGDVSQQQLGAVKGSSPLYRILIES